MLYIFFAVESQQIRHFLTPVQAKAILHVVCQLLDPCVTTTTATTGLADLATTTKAPSTLPRVANIYTLDKDGNVERTNVSFVLPQLVRDDLPVALSDFEPAVIEGGTPATSRMAAPWQREHRGDRSFGRGQHGRPAAVAMARQMGVDMTVDR